MNRLQSKTADAFFSTGGCAGGAGGATQVSYTYTTTGRRLSMSDASGSTSYTYDPLNRLTNMQSTCGAAAPGCGPANTVISSYDYTLGPAGNRLSVAELSGRTVTYGYDDLYRLTSESVVCGTGTPACAPGAISYSTTPWATASSATPPFRQFLPQVY